MKQKHKKIFLIFANSVLAFLMLFSNPLIVSAQATPVSNTATPPTTTVDHTPKPAGDRQISITNYLCTPQGPDNPDGVSLFECINRIYRFSLVAAFFLAVLFIASAGYMYMSGGEKGKEKAKSIISSTFVAIIILTTSFILLRQINPDLVTFKNIQPLEINDVTDFDGTIPIPDVDLWSTGPNATNGTGTPGADIKECAQGIADIPVDIANRSGEKACPTLIEALRALKVEAEKNDAKFTVTDAYGQGHQSICHKVSGTCADVVPVNGNWEGLCKAVNTTGKFRLLNEYKGDGAKAPSCGTYKKTTLSTGNHLHIILQGTADDLEVSN